MIPVVDCKKNNETRINKLTMIRFRIIIRFVSVNATHTKVHPGWTN